MFLLLLNHRLEKMLAEQKKLGPIHIKKSKIKLN